MVTIIKNSVHLFYNIGKLSSIAKIISTHQTTDTPVVKQLPYLLKYKKSKKIVSFGKRRNMCLICPGNSTHLNIGSRVENFFVSLKQSQQILKMFSFT